MVRKLQQRCCGAATCLSTFVAAEPAGQVMDKGCSGVRQRSQINITPGLAARALDFQPRITTVDRLVDGRRGIDWLAVRPHAFVPALAEKAIGLFDQCFAAELEQAIARLPPTPEPFVGRKARYPFPEEEK